MESLSISGDGNLDSAEQGDRQQLCPPREVLGILGEGHEIDTVHLAQNLRAQQSSPRKGQPCREASSLGSPWLLE